MVTTIGSSIWPNWTGIPALPLPSCEVRRRQDTQPASSPGKWSSQEDQHRRVQKARWAVTEGSPGARHSSKPQFQNVLLHYTHRLSSTVQEKGSERLLAISPPGSPIPTSAQWNHKWLISSHWEERPSFLAHTWKLRMNVKWISKTSELLCKEK